MSDRAILLAEQKWLSLITTHIEKIFMDCWMPAHDLRHHERVWRNACNLALKIKIDNSSFFEKLLLACFFHDVGMATNLERSHGLESRKTCEIFLLKHSGKLEFETEQLLDAIENHDNKEYSEQNIRFTNLIYSILAVADDLDAFGAIGVYRYIEICLLRGMDETQSAGYILLNAAKRYAYCHRFMKEYNLNTKVIDLKYSCLNQILSEETFAESPAMLISWINDSIVVQKRDPYTFFNHLHEEDSLDDRRKYFVEQFILEVDNTRYY